MNIVWYGQSFFEIGVRGNGANGNGEVKIAIDPFDENLGLKVPKVEAQILLITHQHPDYFNIKAVQGDPFIIETPGEYEIKGVFLKGIPAFHDGKNGSERGGVVVYTIEAEGMRLCHLSDLGQKELTPEQIEEIGDIDILFIPVGGGPTIDAKDASEIISQIEPKLVIPMHYQVPNLKIGLDGLDKFLKVMGVEGTEKQKKLKVSSKDLPKEETQIVILEP
ncbi:MAG: MBL fold metallo-hydrolase [Candidatus Pacebacteria bacterium]|nr:MBL fold metallo-hydrolase [Candidatus Paceibacterota bacterium]